MRLPARPGLGETLVSVGCLVAVLVMLVAMDIRVKERVSLLFTQVSSEGVGSIGDQAAAVGAAVVQAARDRSLDQAPLLLFSAVGGLLLFLMLRT